MAAAARSQVPGTHVINMQDGLKFVFFEFTEVCNLLTGFIHPQNRRVNALSKVQVLNAWLKILMKSSY